MRHLIDFGDLSREEWDALYNRANQFMDNPDKFNSVCHGKVAASLFYEPSTLTLVESPSGARNPPSLLILPGLLRSDRGGSVSPLIRENGRTPAAYVSGASFLS